MALYLAANSTHDLFLVEVSTIEPGYLSKSSLNNITTKLQVMDTTLALQLV